MAGIAISPLLKINGDVAMAIACAAFCIPTSITIVRRTALPNFTIRERSELHAMVASIRAVMAVPRMAKISKISVVYCKKNISASSIRAGKAALPSILFICCAFCGLKCRSAMPASMGMRNSTMFCMISLPIGRFTSVPACSDRKIDTYSIISGKVNSVIMLLIAVSVTDNATSPFANIENTFDELPPGQQATSNSPIK